MHERDVQTMNDRMETKRSSFSILCRCRLSDRSLHRCACRAGFLPESLAPEPETRIASVRCLTNSARLFSCAGCVHSSRYHVHDRVIHYAYACSLAAFPHICRCAPSSCTCLMHGLLSPRNCFSRAQQKFEGMRAYTSQYWWPHSRICTCTDLPRIFSRLTRS